MYGCCERKTRNQFAQVKSVKTVIGSHFAHWEIKCLLCNPKTENLKALFFFLPNLHAPFLLRVNEIDDDDIIRKKNPSSSLPWNFQRLWKRYFLSDLYYQLFNNRFDQWLVNIISLGSFGKYVGNVFTSNPCWHHCFLDQSSKEWNRLLLSWGNLRVQQK